MNTPIRVGMLGLGTVGTGVARILTSNSESVRSRAGGPLELARIAVRNLDRPRDIELPSEILTTDPEEVVRDPSLPILVELIGCPGGSTEPARKWILEALQAGKHVVTANKDVLAKHGPELYRAAELHGGNLYFEAAVAGGIPIIKAIRESLVGNDIRAIMGIINGTTNYMLTKMSRDQAPFEEVLAEAQALGYAEADPTSDVGGYDAAYKLAILASIAFETEVSVKDVYCEGITGITTEDIRNAAELGYVLKLLGIAKQTDAGVETRVHPTLIPQTHPLAAVNDVFNAIFIEGDAVGELMLYGRGAGMMPTGSAVVADIVDAAVNLRQGVRGRLVKTHRSLPAKPVSEISARYYINLKVVDHPGVLGEIASTFGKEHVSLESVIQKGRGQDPVSLVFITHEVKEKYVQAALERLTQLPVVRGVTNVIRVEGAS